MILTRLGPLVNDPQADESEKSETNNATTLTIKIYDSKKKQKNLS